MTIAEFQKVLIERASKIHGGLDEILVISLFMDDDDTAEYIINEKWNQLLPYTRELAIESGVYQNFIKKQPMH